MNFKKAYKRGLALFLSIIMALSLTIPGLTAEENPVAGAVDKVIEDIGTDWSADDEKDAGELNKDVLDLIQPGNNKDQASDTDVADAIGTEETSGDNVVTGVKNAGDAADDLKDALTETVTKVVEYETEMEAKVDQDGNPVLDAEGNPVMVPKTDDEGNVVVKATEKEVAADDNKTALDSYVETKAKDVENAAKSAAETLEQIKEVVGEGSETVELSQEQFDAVKDQCAQVEAAYNTASAACAEANAAVKAAQDAYDKAIADAKAALENAGDGMSDADVLAAYNAKVEAANKALKDAQDGLAKMEEDVAKLEDAAKILEAYEAAMKAIDEARGSDGTISKEQLAQILGGVAADAEDILKALEKPEDDSTNAALVNTAVDYVRKEQVVKEKQEALDNLPNLEDYERNAAIKHMFDKYPEDMTNVDTDAIKTTEGLYAAIDAAVLKIEKNLGDWNAYKHDVVDGIKENLAILKGEKEGDKEAAIEKLFVKTPLMWGHTNSLVKQLGELDKINVSETERIQTHALLEILDHMLRNEDVKKSAENTHNEDVTEAKTALQTAKDNLAAVDLKGKLDAYLSDETITSETATQTAKVLAAVLAQMDGGSSALDAAKEQAVEAAGKLGQAQDDLAKAREAYLKAQALVKNQEGREGLDADELAGLLQTAKANLEAAQENLKTAKENKDAADNVLDIIEVSTGTDPENPGTDPENPGTDPENPGTNPENPGTGDGTGGNPGDGTTTIPDTDVPLGDGTGAGETITLEDQAVPLAGLISRQVLVSYLYIHEGSPDGVDAEGEYTLALAWAIANDIMDEEDDPEELVTVAIVRDVLTRYAKFLGVEIAVEIEGEDDMIVMNCDEILAAFYARLEELAA